MSPKQLRPKPLKHPSAGEEQQQHHEVCPTSGKEAVIPLISTTKRSLPIEGVICALYRDDGKENGNGNYYIVYQGYIWIMEKKMEATI